MSAKFILIAGTIVLSALGMMAAYGTFENTNDGTDSMPSKISEECAHGRNNFPCGPTQYRLDMEDLQDRMTELEDRVSQIEKR